MEFNGTFLATIITFIVFVFAMNKILYAPILGIMEQRKAFIDDNYQKMQENQAKTDALIQEKEDKLSDARGEAKTRFNEKIAEYKTQKAEVINNAQDNARQTLDKANTELVNLSNEVKEGLKSRMTDLANDIVEKVIGYRSEIQGFDEAKINEVLYKE